MYSAGFLFRLCGYHPPSNHYRLSTNINHVPINYCSWIISILNLSINEELSLIMVSQLGLSRGLSIAGRELAVILQLMMGCIVTHVRQTPVPVKNFCVFKIITFISVLIYLFIYNFSHIFLKFSIVNYIRSNFVDERLRIFIARSLISFYNMSAGSCHYLKRFDLITASMINNCEQ